MPSKEERYKQQLRYREYLKKSWKFGSERKIARGAYADRKKPRRICPHCGEPMKKMSTLDDYYEEIDKTTGTPLRKKRIIHVLICKNCGQVVEQFD